MKIVCRFSQSFPLTECRFVISNIPGLDKLQVYMQMMPDGMEDKEVKLRLPDLRPMTSSTTGWGCYKADQVWIFLQRMDTFLLFKDF